MFSSVKTVYSYVFFHCIQPLLVSDCRFGVSPVNCPDPDPEPNINHLLSKLDNL